MRGEEVLNVYSLRTDTAESSVVVREGPPFSSCPTPPLTTLALESK